MIIVSTRDFRTNQTKYLEMVNAGTDVVLRARAGSYRITPLDQEKDKFAVRDLKAELRGALEEVCQSMATGKSMQSLDDLISSL